MFVNRPAARVKVSPTVDYMYTRHLLIIEGSPLHSLGMVSSSSVPLSVSTVIGAALGEKDYKPVDLGCAEQLERVEHDDCIPHIPADTTLRIPSHF